MVILRAVLAAFWNIAMPFDVQALGIAVASICTGFGTAIGGWGAARRLADNKGAVSDQTSTTTVQTDGSVQQTSQRVDAK